MYGVRPCRHHICDVSYVIRASTPATQEEYADLQKELERQGYTLEIRHRNQDTFLKARERELYRIYDKEE